MSAVYGQNSTNKTPENRTYNIKEGCLIFNGNLINDTNGWIWVYGQSLELSKNIAAGNERVNLIQRFDGEHFHTLKNPDFKGQYPSQIGISKADDAHFFITYFVENEIKLYKINTTTLIFEEIKLPETNVDSVSVYNYKDAFFLFTSTTKVLKVYRFNTKTNTFELTFTKETEFFNIANFQNFIPFENYFIINETRSGIYLFNKEGTFKKQFNLKDLALENKNSNTVLNIETYFKYQDKTYIKFIDHKAYYNYNIDKNTWQKAVFFPEDNFKIEGVFFNDKNELLRIQKTQNGISISNYKENLEVKTYDIKGVYSTKNNIIANESFSQISILEKGNLYQYHFDQKMVQTFLEGKSIRGILELKDQKLLVATDFSGWFIIDLKTAKTTPFISTENGENFVSSGAGKMYEDENFYWSSNSKGVYKIDKKTKVATNFVLYPVSDIIQEKDSLFYGTFNYALMRFDKKKEENTTIIPTKEYNIQSLLKIENTFYLACIEGLLVYNNNKLQLLKPSEKIGDFEMISILKKDDEHIYLGNRSGKLYLFNIKNKTFTLLYNDDLQASIATILIDTENNIWLNTYKGFVILNPATKKWERFGTEEGFSFYEANRYSSLKLSNDFFAVGTLDGLNYFNPKEIKKRKINADLRLTSVTYYDKKTNSVRQENATNYTQNLSEISLPPGNRNLLLQFSLFNITDKKDITYRYRLQKNEPWIELMEKTTIQIFNLIPDEYQLEIEARDSTKKKLGNSIKLNLKVATFFYKTIWFFLLIALVLFAIIFWYYKEQQQKSNLQAQFTKDIINAQEEERKRLARDLHDGVGQQLMLLTRKSKAIENNAIESLATNTLSNLRSISQGLHPVVLERFGFTAAIEELINEVDENSTILFSMDLENIDALLDKNKALHLYRMFQEMLNNMLKYAEAKSANIRIKKEEHQILFLVEDSGKGFDYQNVLKNSKSLGMKSLLERSKIIEALLTIESAENKGTKITLQLPI